MNKSKFIQHPLLSNGSANKHVSTTTREYSNNGSGVFYAVHADMLQAGPVSRTLPMQTS
jgi:hypothetical protein